MRRAGRPGAPPPSAFTPAERRVLARCRTPRQVQQFLNELPYNTEPPPDRPTLRTFRGVMLRRTAHCLEAALTAAVILEQHGYPPLVLSLESIDGLDHVLFVYRAAGRWGAVARSRDPGLHGRRPVFPTLRGLARSYFDPFVDATGCLTAFGLADLRALDPYDWRLSPFNVWKVERHLYAVPHDPVSSSRARVEALRRRYRAFVAAHPGAKPVYYDRRTWTTLPAAFAAGAGRHARTAGGRALSRGRSRERAG